MIYHEIFLLTNKILIKSWPPAKKSGYFNFWVAHFSQMKTCEGWKK